VGWLQPYVGEHVSLRESGEDEEIVRPSGVGRKTKGPAATDSVEGAGAKVGHVALGPWGNHACGLELHVISGHAKIDPDASVAAPAEDLARISGCSICTNALPGSAPAVADQGRDSRYAERAQARRGRSQRGLAAPVVMPVSRHLDRHGARPGGRRSSCSAAATRAGEHKRTSNCRK
jgi:hypothetical protein